MRHYTDLHRAKRNAAVWGLLAYYTFRCPRLWNKIVRRSRAAHEDVQRRIHQ